MRLSGYRQVSTWMARDTLLRYPFANLLGTGLNFAGMAVQVGAVTLALLYARRLETNQPVHVLGESYLPQSSTTLLYLVGAGAGVLLLLSSLMTWWGQKLILQLRRRYYEYCMERLLGLVHERGEPDQLNDREQQVRALFMLIRRDGLYCSRYYGALIGAVVPGVTAAVALITLMGTDWPLTLALILVMVLALPFIYMGNKTSSSLSNQVDQRAPSCSTELKDQLRRSLATGADERHSAKPNSDGWMDAYMGRLGAAIHSDLVINLIMSVAIAALVVGVGYQTISSHTGWGRIAIYLVALRYFLVHLKGFARCITTMNQFYAQASRYRAYVTDGLVPVEASVLADLDDGSEDL